MVPQLTLEQRRHWRISFGIMLACLVSGIAVSNERGVFVPLRDLASTLAVTARAFAALASPPGHTVLEPYENLLLADKPALPPGVPADETPQAMMARILDAPPEPGPPLLMAPPPAFGPLAPITFSQTPNIPGITPFQPAPSFVVSVPLSVVPETPTAPVPEPSSWALLIAGFAAIGWVQRRVARKTRQAAA